jgi:hypothetical protein
MAGMPKFLLEEVIAHFDYWRSGVGAEIASHVADLVGRPPRTFEAFAHDYAAPSAGRAVTASSVTSCCRSCSGSWAPTGLWRGCMTTTSTGDIPSDSPIQPCHEQRQRAEISDLVVGGAGQDGSNRDAETDGMVRVRV